MCSISSENGPLILSTSNIPNVVTLSLANSRWTSCIVPLSVTKKLWKGIYKEWRSKIGLIAILVTVMSSQWGPPRVNMKNCHTSSSFTILLFWMLTKNFLPSPLTRNRNASYSDTSKQPWSYHVLCHIKILYYSRVHKATPTGDYVSGPMFTMLVSEAKWLLY